MYRFTIITSELGECINIDGATLEELTTNLLELYMENGSIKRKFGDGYLPANTVPTLPPAPEGYGIVFKGFSCDEGRENVGWRLCVKRGCQIVALPMGEQTLGTHNDGVTCSKRVDHHVVIIGSEPTEFYELALDLLPDTALLLTDEDGWMLMKDLHKNL